MKNSSSDIKTIQGYISVFKSILPSKREHHYGRATKSGKLHGKNNSNLKYYDIAKEEETKYRNLDLAMYYYSKAVVNGQKINTCIKDFASVLHQSGMTQTAVKFLDDMRPAYEGDIEKYDRLLSNLKMQINPTGKHACKRILLDMKKEQVENPQESIQQMFSNDSRIREYTCSTNLSLEKYELPARYLVLTFDSFSAAKKTLQTFNEQQWFHVDKYWMDENFNIVTQAINGRQDFENGILFKDGVIEKYNGQDVPPNYLSQFKAPRLSYLKTNQKRQATNELAMYFIQLKNSKQTYERMIKQQCSD